MKRLLHGEAPTEHAAKHLRGESRGAVFPMEVRVDSPTGAVGDVSMAIDRDQGGSSSQIKAVFVNAAR